MKPSTPETARRRRSPARRRPSEAAGALDFGAVDQPSAKTESDRKGTLSRVAIARARPIIGALFNDTGGDLVLVHGAINGQRVCASESMLCERCG